MPGETGWRALDATARAKGVRIGPPTPGQTDRYRGTGTFHDKGRARDYGLRDSDANAVSRLFAPLAAARPDLIPEMFGSDGVGYDEGRPYQAPGHTGDHTHVAIGAGVTTEDLLAALDGVDVAPSGGGVNVPATQGITETGLRRVFLIVGGAVLFLAGAAFLGTEFSPARAVARGVGLRV